jgi:hypothetical protein
MGFYCGSVADQKREFHVVCLCLRTAILDHWLFDAPHVSLDYTKKSTSVLHCSCVIQGEGGIVLDSMTTHVRALSIRPDNLMMHARSLGIYCFFLNILSGSERVDDSRMSLRSHLPPGLVAYWDMCQISELKGPNPHHSSSCETWNPVCGLYVQTFPHNDWKARCEEGIMKY